MVNEMIRSRVLKTPIESKEGDLIDLIGEYVGKVAPNLKMKSDKYAHFIRISDPKNWKKEELFKMVEDVRRF